MSIVIIIPPYFVPVLRRFSTTVHVAYMLIQRTIHMSFLDSLFEHPAYKEDTQYLSEDVILTPVFTLYINMCDKPFGCHISASKVVIFQRLRRITCFEKDNIMYNYLILSWIFMNSNFFKLYIAYIMHQCIKALTRIKLIRDIMIGLNRHTLLMDGLAMFYFMKHEECIDTCSQCTMSKIYYNFCHYTMAYVKSS